MFAFNCGVCSLGSEAASPLSSEAEFVSNRAENAERNKGPEMPRDKKDLAKTLQ